MVASLALKRIVPENKKSTPKPFKRIKGLERKKVWGFSMFETVAGIALMSLFFVYTMQIISQGYAASAKSMRHVGAYGLARQTLEEYSRWSTLDGINGSPLDGIVPNVTNSSSSIINNITYSCVLTITDGPVYGSVPLKQLNATISWGGGSFSAYSLKSNY